MPCCAYAHCTSPEQSKPFASVPPHTYGVPSASSAERTTSAALPRTVAGADNGGIVLLGHRRSIVRPIVSDMPIAAATPAREFRSAPPPARRTADGPGDLVWVEKPSGGRGSASGPIVA